MTPTHEPAPVLRSPPGETTASPAPRVAVVVGVLSLAVFMSGLDMFIVNLAFPTITKAFRGTDIASLSWVLNAYTIVFAAVLVPAGRVADRVGRRRLLVTGLAVFALGSAACGLAPDVTTLVAARVLQALGAGLMVPASLSLLLAAVPPSARPAAIGSWSAFAALGAALGPVIGGLLVQVSWRSVFWVNLPVAVIAIALSLKVLPESRESGVVHRPDVVGAVALAVSVGALAYGLVKAPVWGWSSLRFAGSLVAGAAVLGVTLQRSRRHRAPVLDLELLRNRWFSGAAAASVLYYAGFGAFVLNSVEFLTGVWHYSPVSAGLAIGPGPVMVLPFARVVAPRLGRRLGGPGRVAVLGCLVNAGAQSLWWFAMTPHAAYVTHLLPVQLLGGAGVGLTIPSLLAAGSAGIPANRFGTASGVLNMSRQVGTVLGVAALVGLLAHPSADVLVPFRHGVLLIVAFSVGAAGLSAALLTRGGDRSGPIGAPAAERAVAVAAPTIAAP